MTLKQKELHKRFLNFREAFGRMEIEFIKILQEVEKTKLYRAFGCASVFQYAVDVITFSESVAYTYILVARKAREFPALIESSLSVSKASRIVSALNKENSAQLIQFALTHTTNEINREVARRNPKAGQESVKYLSEEYFEIKIQASKDFPEKLKRIEAIQAQRGKKAGPGAALEAACDEYIRRYDPVQKTARAIRRKEKAWSTKSYLAANLESGEFHRVGSETGPGAGAKAYDVNPAELCLNKVGNKRMPLTAEQKHEVFARDGGKCTQVNAKGERCGSDRWVHIHHIVEVSRGGNNNSENLTTLCSFHHDLVHQLSFPIEGQINWLRSPEIAYTF